jgi:lysophospholipase L1-like esterase
VLAAGAMAALARLVTGGSQAARSAAMKHVVLLGDSTLDNAAYVAAGQDVTSKLRNVLPRDWRITLLALDGAMIRDVAEQLRTLPADASHLIVSVGGNDALDHAGIIEERAASVGGALARLADVRDAFAAEYRTMLDGVLRRALPTAVSTIYEANLPDAQFMRVGRTALTALNDAITREAARRGLPLIDLRVIFDSPADYANPIEPSAEGGAKFAAAIAAVVQEHDFAKRRSEIFAPAARSG